MSLIGNIGRMLGRQHESTRAKASPKGARAGPATSAGDDVVHSPDIPLGPELLETLAEFDGQTREEADVRLLERLRRHVEDGGVDLPAMPDEVRRLQQIIRDPDCSTARLAHAIVTDPTLSAKFVAVANAPFYSRGMRVRSVRDAVCRVGMTQAVMIIMAVVAHTKLFVAGRFQTRASQVHVHSLATAVVAQLLARRSAADEQDAFMAGLLHALGKIVVLQTAQEVEGDDAEASQVDAALLDRITETLHAGLSALTLETWDFAPEVVTAVRHHNTTAKTPADADSATRLGHLLSAANWIGWLVTEERDVEEETLRTTLEQLGLELDPLILDEARATFDAFLAQVGS